MQVKKSSGQPNDVMLLLKHSNELVDVAKAAQRNKKSLSGDNFYGQKFHGFVVATRSGMNRLNKALAATSIDAFAWEDLRSCVDTLCSPSHKPTVKASLLKRLKLLIETAVRPSLEGMTANPIPESEQVLPLAVLTNTRNYFVKVITQANGCYEHQWFDACSVLIRRFVETLIVEVYEAKGKASEIQDTNGDFYMLQKLIDATLSEKTAWNLGRETKKTLPLVKKLGDRAAHNRRYVATKKDVDEVVPGLRIVADDLLHLAGIK